IGLRTAWCILVIGIIIMILSFAWHHASLALAGIICLVVGYLIALLDIFLHRKRRDKLTSLHFYLLLSPILSLFPIIFIALLATLVVLFLSLNQEIAAPGTVRILNFFTVVFGLLIVIGLASFGSRV